MKITRGFVAVAAVLAITAGAALAAGAIVGPSGKPVTTLITPATGTPTTRPARNVVYSCVRALNAVQPHNYLAQPDRPWVYPGSTARASGTIRLGKRPFIQGNVHYRSRFKVTVTRTKRQFKGNGLPATPTGIFPVTKATSPQAYQYYAADKFIPPPYHNAAEMGISPWKLAFSVPRDPKLAAKPHCIGPKLTTGVALVGATYHVELAPPNRRHLTDPQAVFPFDHCFGHPFPTQYHFHALSYTCMARLKRFRSLNNPHRQSPLLGYAIDGFGIYGPRGAGGKWLYNKDLDQCHGLTSKVWFNGRYQRIYHYVINNQFPYSLGCFRGTPVKLPKWFA